MKGKLKKIVSTHNNLRTTEMEGEFHKPPIIGQDFVIFGKALDPDADVRMIRTTPVKALKDIADYRMVFFTQNSEYELEIYPLNDKEELFC
jgi:hypothetical protein